MNYFFGNFNIHLNNIIIFIIIYLIAFSFFNISLFKFYYGDSGCYAIANIINFFLIFHLLNFDTKSFYFFSSLYLPITDVLFVIMLRIYLHESIVTRNNYHLYQQISLKISGFYYLLPTLLFPVLIILIYNYFLMHFLQNFYLINLVNFLICFIIYISISIYIKKYKNKKS